MIDHSLIIPPPAEGITIRFAGGATVAVMAEVPGGPYRWIASAPGTWCEASTSPTMTAAAHAGAAAVEKRRRAA